MIGLIVTTMLVAYKLCTRGRGPKAGRGGGGSHGIILDCMGQPPAVSTTRGSSPRLIGVGRGLRAGEGMRGKGGSYAQVDGWVDSGRWVGWPLGSSISGFV